MLLNIANDDDGHRAIGLPSQGATCGRGLSWDVVWSLRDVEVCIFICCIWVLHMGHLWVYLYWYFRMYLLTARHFSSSKECGA